MLGGPFSMHVKRIFMLRNIGYSRAPHIHMALLYDPTPQGQARQVLYALKAHVFGEPLPLDNVVDTLDDFARKYRKQPSRPRTRLRPRYNTPRSRILYRHTLSRSLRNRSPLEGRGKMFVGDIVGDKVVADMAAFLLGV